MIEPRAGGGTVERAPAMDESALQRIRSALQRSVQVVEHRPAKAIGTAVTRVRVREGMTCEVRDGDWDLVIDLPVRWGGADEGPNPGVVGRGALGACLSMAYLRWAADAGLPIDSLEVEIQADYDARGELGLADVTPAYTEVCYTVDVRSPAPPEELRRAFERAEERCPWLKVFADPMPMRRELRLESSDPGARSLDGEEA